MSAIRRLLVANRGEIAVRVIRAARELGIASVAIASEADARAMHVREADEAVVIGPAPATQSYLAQSKILEVARERKCDAIHPGYGFLAQNPEFADAVEAAGLAWVGPPASAIRLMGDKTAARRSMRAAGVPIVPGFEGNGAETDERLLEEAGLIGLPLMVKAAAGGGGRGMRVVREAGELRDALVSARRESEKAFGDGRLFLERYVEDARHIEVQVLADARGGCVHLFERECSIQRRHQKIVEESPSPLLDAEMRARMGAAAVAAARACGYVNAGTIEFLVGRTWSSRGSGSGSGADGVPAEAKPRWEFFFLEMNTRIQVEHPVTELVTGIDLVQAQLRVAAGEALPWKQEDLAQRGHAIECRLNAEDPDQDFAPSAGKALLARYPEGPGVRVDAGYETGDEVSTHYDSLIAKVLAYGETRAAAIRRMERALEATAVLGPETNREYLRAVLAHPVFRAGEATTGFVAKELPRLPARPAGIPEEALIAAAVFSELGTSTPVRPGPVSSSPAHPDGDREAIGAESKGAEDGASPWSRADAWRPGGGS